MNYREQVKQSKELAAKEGVIVPETIKDYCIGPTAGEGAESKTNAGDWDCEDMEDYYEDVLSGEEEMDCDSTGEDD